MLSFGGTEEGVVSLRPWLEPVLASATVEVEDPLEAERVLLEKEDLAQPLVQNQKSLPVVLEVAVVYPGRCRGCLKKS